MPDLHLGAACRTRRPLRASSPPRSHPSNSAKRDPGQGPRERNTQVAAGTGKWFKSTKGYGFISPSEGDKDVFVHISAVERAGLGTLNEGQQLQYELARGNNGKFSAVNVKID